MIKKVIAAVILVTLLTVAIVQAMDKKTETPETTSQTTAGNEGLAIGAKAPDFELKTLTGETVKLSNLKGKKVMLNFWATWCPPCKAEMPAMENFYKNKADDYNLEIIAVNLTADERVINKREKIKEFIDEYGLTFPVPLDVDGAIGNKYKIIAI